MATFTLHRVRIFIPDGSTCPSNRYDYDIDEYIADYDVCDYDHSIIVFGQVEAWALYRKEVNKAREHEAFTVEIYRALVPTGAVISGHRRDDDDMKQLNWELLDRTTHHE